MNTSTFVKGLRAFWIFNSTPDEPSQRNVVFSPRSGRPSCSQRATRLPLRTLANIPAANQATRKITARKNSPRPASGEMIHKAAITKWLTQSGGDYHKELRSTSNSSVEDPVKHESFRQRLRDFFYGMTGYEFERQATEMRGALENVFMTVTLGDMLGLPIIPPVYSLRLLPYVVPSITTWKYRVSRRRELPESEEYDLHGM